MAYETTLQKNGGSVITVVPSGIVKLLELTPGKKLQWNFKISDGTPEICITPIKE